MASASDSVPKPGEIRKGNTLFSPAAVLRLTPLEPEAYYVLEAYNDGAEESGTMAVEVVDGAGKAMFQTPNTPVKVAASGGMLKGRLDLEGLPPGGYQLKVLLQLGTRSVDRSAPMTMADLDATLEQEVTRINAEKVSDEGYFKYMSTEGLDSAFAPLYYVATPTELKVWNKSLSDDAKRSYLTDFWQSRDPDKGTAGERGAGPVLCRDRVRQQELQGTQRPGLEDGSRPHLRQERRARRTSGAGRRSSARRRSRCGTTRTRARESGTSSPTGPGWGTGGCWSRAT